MNKDLAITESDVSPIVEKATALSVMSQDTLAISVEMLSQCNIYLDKLTEDKEKITKPLNAALKEIRAKYKPVEEILTTAIATIRGKQSQYQTELMRKQKENEMKIAEKLASGKLSIEKAVSKLEQVQVPTERITTTTGSLKFREDKVLVIVDPYFIPREYLLPDEKAIMKVLKEGGLVAGCVLESKMVPINSR